MLEIGCGTGNVSSAFDGREYVGLDTDAGKVSRAQERWGRPGRTFLTGRLEDVGLAPKSFDFVVASHLIHHLPDETLLALLAEVRRVLRAQGVLVVLDMVRPRPGDPLGAWLYCHADRGRYIRVVEAIERLLESGGFATVEAPRIIGCRKLGFRIIDQVVLRARPASLTHWSRRS